VPELLGELAGTREHQEHALYELYGNIWHQGTVYEATAHAVPFLARLALSEPAPLRDELLALLAHIANGSSYSKSTRTWSPAVSPRTSATR
jgi:hypothetical protein